MSKMSISDAALHFGISKEAIHNRVRRGSLESVVEDGEKLVIISGTTTNKSMSSGVSNKNTEDDKYYKLLQEQNSRLELRIEALEGETRSLRDQKELMLIQEREKIEQIYKDKDEQLKNILNAIASKFMIGSVEQEPQEALEAELEIEADEVEVQESKNSSLISLKRYLKFTELSYKKKDKIKKIFKEKAKKDERIITIDKKIYLDLGKYEYQDLL